MTTATALITTATEHHKSLMSKVSMRSTLSAMEKVDETKQDDSHLSQYEKPPPEDYEKKSEYCWRLIRHCVRHAVDVVTKADMLDIAINHGVRYSRRIDRLSCLHQVMYNMNTKEYVMMDGKDINVFHTSGRHKLRVPLTTVAINRILLAVHENLYIGWIYDDNVFTVMSTDFEVLSVANTPRCIQAAVYNVNIGEVVTVGRGQLTTWVFRYGGRHLLARRTTTEGLDRSDDYSLLVLEETASRSQKAFIFCGSSVMVYNVFDGKFIVKKTDLHARLITAALFFNPLKYLITAGMDGSIKVWDDRFHLQLVFVGHSGRVTSLALYPFGPLIMSASTDRTIRVWSLESCDEVDNVKTNETCLSLITSVNHATFASMSASYAEMWTINNIHMLHANIGHKVEHMKCTDHPEYPMRVLLLCRDASVRMLCPSTGNIMTTLMGDPRNKLVDAAYAIEKDTMFAVYSNGDIIKCKTSTNPCTILSRWECKKPKEACNYLLVYEYVIRADFESDTWGGMKRAITTKQVAHESATMKNASRTLLLGGRKDGHICVFDWTNGKILFEIEAHGHKGVLSMIANSRHDQLISAGLDNVIKIWRLYPYAHESLVPLMSFYCAHTPAYMTVMRSKLAVAFQEHSNATYSVVMYNLNRRNRNDHGPEDDHFDSITGLSSSNKLRLIASCSNDGTIRIWNEENALIRVLRLNAVPHSLAFCSQRGDLLIGVGDHVHHIEHTKYLPKRYRVKMVAIPFDEPAKEKPLPFDRVLLAEMSRDDIKRLKAAHASFKFTHFVDLLTQDESEELAQEREDRQKAFEALQRREHELWLISEGQLKAQPRRKLATAAKTEAFQKYLDIFYKRPKIEPVVEEVWQDPEVTQKEERYFRMEEPSEYQPPFGPTGFFRPGSGTPTSELPHVIRNDGFVPNSILAHLLWPDRKPESEPESDHWQPPVFDKSRVSTIPSYKRAQSAVTTATGPTLTPTPRPNSHTQQQNDGDSLHGSPLFMDYSDDEEAKEEDEPEEEEEEECLVPVPSPAPRTPVPPAKVDIIKTPSPELMSEARILNFEGDLRQSVDAESSYAAEKSERISEVAFENVLVEDAVSIISEPERQISSPLSQKRDSTPHKPSSSRLSLGATTSLASPTELSASPVPSKYGSEFSIRVPNLPYFILKHCGSEWFQHYFPNPTLQTFENALTLDGFIMKVLECLRVSNTARAADVVQALREIHREDGMPNLGLVYHNVLQRMQGVTGCGEVPSCKDEDGQLLIERSLRMLHSINCKGLDFFSETVAQFIDGIGDIRRLVREILEACGMHDPRNMFAKELDSWDVWNLDSDIRPLELRKLSMNWLSTWKSSFIEKVVESIQDLKKGKKIHAHLSKQAGWVPKAKIKAIHIERVDKCNQDHAEKKPTRTREKRATSIDLFIQELGDGSEVDSVGFVSIINYFVEVQMCRQQELMHGEIHWPNRAVRNTVVVLPKIPGKSCLLRHGETHESKCHPDRETTLAIGKDFRLPILVPKSSAGHEEGLYNMPYAINMPLKTLYLNPFPSPIDAFDLPPEDTPLLLTLRTAQKYFIQNRSVPYLQQEQW